MNFTDFFTRGFSNTLKFKNQANFSFRGTAVTVTANTVIDSWNLQDFSSATYEIVMEYGTDDVEHVNIIASARANQASVTVFGRTNLGRDLVQFTATVDNNVVKIIANPFYATDTVTPLAGIKVIYKATYSERVLKLSVPQTVGETSSLGGAQGLQLNWNNSNLPNGFLSITESGLIEIGAITNVAVPGQTTLSAAFILDSLAITNSDNSISLTTDSIGRILSFTASNYPSIGVTGAFTSSLSGTTNTIDRTTIGSIAPTYGQFTVLGSTGATTFSGNTIIRPTGTGTVTMSSATTGSMDNVLIGSVTPASGRFSNLTLNTETQVGNNLINLNAVKKILLLGAIK